MNTPSMATRNNRGTHWSRWKSVAIALGACVVAAALLLAAMADHIRLGAEAYVYGFPLVITDVTRANAATSLGPANQLLRVRKFPDAQFREVVRPNVDTLYTTAFIDTTQGPWVFEMQANAERYAVLPFMDAWTNVFASLGTRTTGTAGGRFVLVGPAWQGEVPAGHMLLRAPTQIVWLIGRTQANGEADYPTVHRLQDGLALRAYSSASAPVISTANASPAPPHTHSTPWQASHQQPMPALAQLRAMPVDDFFKRLAMLMVLNPPAPADAAVLGKMARIGIAPGKPPQWNTTQRASVALGRWLADRSIARALAVPRGQVNGWSTPPANLGDYGTDYNTRAVVAMIGLGANQPADAMYPSTSVDAQGNALNGSKRYRLHFPAGGLPPVHAFWSVTAYGRDDFLIDNPVHRYALGDRDPLLYNADGSLDLYIQSTAPASPYASNWLPVKDGADFLLNARLYWPKQPALGGSWHMPAVELLP